MATPQLFDTVELLVDLPEQGICQGALGAIVHCYPDDTYEVEFTDEDGETLALCTLPSDRFIVIWRAETKDRATCARVAPPMSQFR
jgi:hypothetical protein